MKRSFKITNINIVYRSTLQRHMTRHTGKLYTCPEPGCVYAGRNPSEVKIHLVSHSNERPFACPRCNYKGKTKNQLMRYALINQKLNPVSLQKKKMNATLNLYFEVKKKTDASFSANRLSIVS